MIVYLYNFAYHCFMHISEALIGLLNTKRVTRQHWVNLLAAGGSNPMAMRSFLKAVVAQRKLQEYVGGWIDSGFRRDGSEEPERRAYTTWNCQTIFETLGPVLSCSHTIPTQGVFALQASKQAPTPPTRCSLGLVQPPRWSRISAHRVFGNAVGGAASRVGLLSLLEISPTLHTYALCPLRRICGP